MQTETRDEGMSLIELLLVMLIIGVLSTIVVLAVGESRSNAEESGCVANRRSLTQAVEAYRAVTSSDGIVATGVVEPYEQTLVAGGFLTTTSVYYDLDATGSVVIPAGSPCTV